MKRGLYKANAFTPKLAPCAPALLPTFLSVGQVCIPGQLLSNPNLLLYLKKKQIWKCFPYVSLGYLFKLLIASQTGETDCTQSAQNKQMRESGRALQSEVVLLRVKPHLLEMVCVYSSI